MRVTAPDGAEYEVARAWAGSWLGRPGRIVARWWRRVGRAARPKRLEDAMDVGEATGLLGELPAWLAGLILLVMFLLVVAVVLPIVAFLMATFAEFALLLLLVPLVFAWKVVTGSEWRVEVRHNDVVVWSVLVAGFAASGRAEVSVGDQLRRGLAPKLLSLAAVTLQE